MFASVSMIGIATKEHMRSFLDIEQGKSEYLAAALKYYDALAEKAVGNGHVIDVFSASYDQVGLMELRSCVNNTGGYMFTTEQFTSETFSKSLLRVFSRDRRSGDEYVSMALNAVIEVHVRQSVISLTHFPPTCPLLSYYSFFVSFVLSGDVLWNM